MIDPRERFDGALLSLVLSLRQAADNLEVIGASNHEHLASELADSELAIVDGIGWVRKAADALQPEGGE